MDRILKINRSTLVESMSEEEKSLEEKVAEEKQNLELLIKEVYEIKLEILNQAREKCHTASLKKSSIDFDGLNQLKDSSTAALEQKKLEINEIRDNMVQTEDAIAKLNEEFKQGQEELNLLQTEITGVAAANITKETQVLHEKNMFEDHLQSMYDEQSDRIVNGNINLAREVVAVLNILDENESIKQDLNKEITMNIEKENNFAEESVKIASAIEKLEEEIETISESRILIEQNEKLIKGIEDMRKEKQEMIQDYGISSEICKAKIQKEEQRQTVLGVVDDDKSGNVSSDELKSLASMTSSYTSESNVKAERINFNLSVVSSSSEQPSKKDKKRKSN